MLKALSARYNLSYKSGVAYACLYYVKFIYFGIIPFIIELITKIKKLAQQLKMEQTEHEKIVQLLQQECDAKKEIEQQLLIVGKEKEV